MGKRILFLLACIFMTASMAFAQRQVTGTVTDSETGEPLPGATVKVQGTTLATITDIDGKFQLKNVPQNSRTVIVTFMGMKTAEVGIRSNLNITMIPDYKAIDEVMVVAYGTQKKSAFTGSAVEVKSEDISKHVASTATTALVGKVAGLQATSSDGGPGEAPTIRLRGIGSISAGSSPLYIVDGAPYEAGIATINPSDIESISVLKDASASAIYGARGANGVIIITTKKAKAGQDPSVNFEARWGSNSRLIPKYDLIENPAEFYETHYRALYNSKIYNGGTSAEAYAFADANLFDQNNGGLGYQVYTIPDGEKFIGTNFKLNPNAKLGYVKGDYFYTPDNWYDEAFHNSFRQEYNVSAQGATDRFNYYANLGFLDDGGSVNNSGYKRYTARINTDYQIKKWLKFNFSMGYTHGDTKNPRYTDTYGSSGNMFYIANTIAPIYPLYVRNADGTIKTENGRTIYDSNQTGFMRAGTMGNAVRDNEYDSKTGTSDLFNGKWSLSATPVKGLTLTATLNAMAYNSRTRNLYSPFGANAAVDGLVSVSHLRRFTTNQQYLAQYETTIADDHNLQVLAGYEQYNLKEQNLSGSNDHIYSPFVGELNNALGTKSKTNSSNTDSYMTEGFLGRALYDYKDTYFLSASYRRDASSVFAPGHRWGNFGSVGAAWQINKMNFMKDVKWVNLLKLKASYGMQGNDDLGSYHAYADLYSTSYNEETGEYALQMQEKGNENLTWESSYQWNVGVDFVLFNHRLNGSLEFYHRSTSDMLYYRGLPLSSGISATDYPDNVGNMYNRGIEFTLNGTLIKTQDFNWDLNLNMTHNKNKITNLDGEEIISTSRILKEGGNIYESYMVQYAGTDKENGRAQYWVDTKDAEGNVTGRQKTYDLTAASKYECGSTLPKLLGGFGTTLEFKGFDLSAQFTYQLGGQIYDGAYQAFMHNGQSQGIGMHRDLLNAWSTTNRNSDIPRLSTASIDDPGVSRQIPIDRFLTSSNYLSLNNLTLGYSLPATVLSRIGMRNLRVYVSGENLFLLTKRQGLDPRYNFGIGSMTQGQGLANGAYASMRSVVAGLSLKF